MPRANRSNMLQRWLKLWLPFDSRLIISGIERADGVIVNDPEAKHRTLAKHWKPVFKYKPTDKQTALLLCQAQPDMSADVGEQPTEQDVEEYLERVSHSSCGPDGIPYIAWLKAGKLAFRTLFLVVCNMCNGFLAPPKFNESFIALPPKGSRPDDPTRVIRKSEETRPLNLKNCDTMHVARCV